MFRTRITKQSGDFCPIYTKTLLFITLHYYFINEKQSEHATAVGTLKNLTRLFGGTFYNANQNRLSLKNMDSIFLTPKIRLLGEQLMHHQCWFFGRDIWHDDGNLLIRYGFERSGVPENETGGNAYRLFLNKREIVLWGFGLFIGEESGGGVFIKRYDFSPKFLTVSHLNLPIWKSEQIPVSNRPLTIYEQQRVLRLTCSAVDWITEYEAWVEKNCGKDWRKKCLEEWNNTELSPHQINRGWKRLKKYLENREKRNTSRIPRSCVSGHIG